MEIRKNVLLLRRFLLQHFVPELYWPKMVQIDGAVIKLRGAPYSFGTKWILKKGSYEQAERVILKDILFDGAKVIEMGGSIGILTAIISKHIGSTGKIVSVEASAKLTAFSNKWLTALGNVVVETGFGFPVYQVPASLQVNSFDETAGSLGGVVSFTNTASLSNRVDENLFDLKKIIDRHAISPDILVIDIESSELILKNTNPKIPASVRSILIELHPGMYENGQKDTEAIIDAICKEGFVLSKCEQVSYLFQRTTGKM